MMSIPSDGTDTFEWLVGLNGGWLCPIFGLVPFAVSFFFAFVQVDPPPIQIRFRLTSLTHSLHSTCPLGTKKRRSHGSTTEQEEVEVEEEDRKPKEEATHTIQDKLHPHGMADMTDITDMTGIAHHTLTLTTPLTPTHSNEPETPSI